MWPDMSWFERKRILNGGFTTLTAIRFRCRAVTSCKTPMILLKSPNVRASRSGEAMLTRETKAIANGENAECRSEKLTMDKVEVIDPPTVEQ
jgi:hypothetical protein